MTRPPLRDEAARVYAISAAPLAKALRAVGIPQIERIFRSWDAVHPGVEETVRAVIQDSYFTAESRRMIMAAANLAAEPNGNPFHNNRHFLEVFSFTFMIGQHALDYGRMDERDFARLLSAALIHDYKHDGGTNTVNGVHYPFRLELLAFDSARDKLALAGAGRVDLKIIEALVMATDVSQPQDLPNMISPADSVKKYVTSGDAFFLHPGLMILKNPKLADMAMMLHDADIGASATLSRSFCEMSSGYLADEWGIEAPAGFSSGFIEHVCQKRLFSTSGYTLLQPHMDRVAREFGLDPFGETPETPQP